MPSPGSFFHLRPHTLKMGWTDSAVRRYVRCRRFAPVSQRRAGQVRCDHRQSAVGAAVQNRIDELEVRIAELSAKRRSLGCAPIDGNQVMAYLGIGPGPEIGDIMGLMLERRSIDGPYSVGEAYAMVRDWAIDQGLPDPGPSP